MLNKEWPAADYEIGSHIQRVISNKYLSDLHFAADDAVLDIGCGEGAYSTNIIEQIPQGTFLGIDASANMLQLAQKKLAKYPQVSLLESDILETQFSERFNYIVSFWCLHWVKEIETAYQKIYAALKKEGHFFTIFSLGKDPYIQACEAIKASGKFPFLNDFKSPFNLFQISELSKQIAKIPFKQLQVEEHQEILELPSLDIFRRFVKGISFYQGQIPDDMVDILNEEIVGFYDNYCQEQYQGKYNFQLSICVVKGQR